MKKSEGGMTMAVVDESVVVLDERLFRDLEDGGYWEEPDNASYIVDLKTDSWVWCFTGRRGGGKTTLMTLFACKAAVEYPGIRLVSNYPVDFYIRRATSNGHLERYTAEKLDFIKLLSMDQDYRNVLILLDEAPDIVSHLASMSWKNRLLDIFVRQLRKNGNSLFMAAQDFGLIDKGMRWQTDLIVECKDASKFANNHLERGECILADFYDNSGQFTGWDTDDRIHRHIDPVIKTAEMFPRVLWGVKGKTKPVFDSYYVMDIWESLRKVDLKLSSMTVGDQGDKSDSDKYPVSIKTLQAALRTVEEVLAAGKERPDVYQKWFYQSLGGVTDADKNNLGKLLSRFNIERGGEGSQRWYGFSSFDVDGFRTLVKEKVSSISH